MIIYLNRILKICWQNILNTKSSGSDSGFCLKKLFSFFWNFLLIWFLFIYAAIHLNTLLYYICNMDLWKLPFISWKTDSSLVEKTTRICKFFWAQYWILSSGLTVTIQFCFFSQSLLTIIFQIFSTGTLNRCCLSCSFRTSSYRVYIFNKTTKVRLVNMEKRRIVYKQNRLIFLQSIFKSLI